MPLSKIKALMINDSFVVIGAFCYVMVLSQNQPWLFFPKSRKKRKDCQKDDKGLHIIQKFISGFVDNVSDLWYNSIKMG